MRNAQRTENDVFLLLAELATKFKTLIQISDLHPRELLEFEDIVRDVDKFLSEDECSEPSQDELLEERVDELESRFDIQQESTREHVNHIMSLMRDLEERLDDVVNDIESQKDT